MQIALRETRGCARMKGVILAGGIGSRLFPLTRVTNKHLLPVYDRPMIFCPIQTLVNAGIKDILVVTGGQDAGDFLRLLGNGKDFGLQHINYTYQYDSTVFERIRKLKPSGRGEFEITDVNNQYLADCTLTHSILEGWWTDAGTFDSLLRATNLVAQGGANKVS